MILVKIETLDRSVPDRILNTSHVVADTIGGALNAYAPDPAVNASFRVSVIDLSVASPVHDKGGR